MLVGARFIPGLFCNVESWVVSCHNTIRLFIELCLGAFWSQAMFI